MATSMHIPGTPEPTPIPAAVFWDAYFENRLVHWRRGDGECAGLIRTTAPGGPAAFLTPPELTPFACAHQELAAYDTLADGRFARLTQQPRSAADALAAMIDASYPYRDPAPFGKDRMAELLRECRRLLGDERESLAEPGLRRALGALLVQLVDRADAALHPAIAALVFLLGELRDAGASPALLAVVRNADGMPFAKQVMHFRAVGAAYAALWKVNGKAAAPELLVLMRDADGSARQKLAALFERLFSAGELISLHKFGEAWLTPEFWMERLQPLLPPAAWPELDARNLFWELRWLLATRVDAGHAQLLSLLQHDEVGLVRATATARRVELAAGRR